MMTDGRQLSIFGARPYLNMGVSLHNIYTCLLSGRCDSLVACVHHDSLWATISLKQEEIQLFPVLPQTVLR